MEAVRKRTWRVCTPFSGGTVLSAKWKKHVQTTVVRMLVERPQLNPQESVTTFNRQLAHRLPWHDAQQPEHCQ